MPKPYLFFYFFLVCLSAVHAQGNYQKGYVVRNNGDTLKGFIDQREWARNPSSITFKESIDAVSTQELAIGQIQYFEVTGNYYQRFVVSVSMDGVEMRRQLDIINVSAVTDTVLLKVLQKGKNVSLFSYRDAVKIRYYLLEPDSNTPKELIYRMYKVAETSSQSERVGFLEIYKNQLQNAAQKAGRLSENLKWRISKISYGDQLLKIVSIINGLSRPDNNVRSSIHFYAGLGVNKSTVYYHGETEFARNSASSPSYAPYYLIGLEYGGKTGAGPLHLTTELMLTTAKNHTTSFDNTLSTPLQLEYTFTQHTVNISIQAKYYPYNKQKMKIFLASGLRFSIASYSDNMYTLRQIYPTSVNETQIKDFFQLNTFWPSLPLKAGLVLSNKVEVSFSYILATGLNQYSQLIREKIAYTQAGVSFYFK